jgi:hypothetical protein
MSLDFKNEIINKLKGKKLDNGKPKLTDSSINLYVRNIERLNDDSPLKSIKDLYFLENIEAIKDKLSNYKLNTQRQYYISIINILDLFKSNKKFTKIYEKYHKIMIDKADEIEAIPSDEMNNNQKENWIGWDEVENVYNTLKIKVMKLTKNKELTEKQYNELLGLFVLSLYVNNPPRRNADYMFMNIVKTEDNTTNEKFNYLVYDNNEFIFNKFKTAKSFEQQKIKYNEEQKEIIKLYLKYHPLIKGKLSKTTDISLLMYYDGSPLEKVNSITRILNKVFKKYTNKRISSSLLRHIFITDKLSDEVKKQKDIADKMGHSVATQKEYIKDLNDLE